MNEWLMILVMGVSGVLFAAGGTHIEGIGGQKWLRRVLLPVFLTVVAYFQEVEYWQLGAFLVLSFPLWMGYGSSSPYWKKMLTFSLYPVASLVFGFSWWVVITPIVLMLLFLGSNFKPLATTIFWKAWEFIAGVLIALCYIGALTNRW